MKCNESGCDKEAIFMHGISVVTHGYCEEHRCCKNCGRKINLCYEEKGCDKPSCDKPSCDKPKEREIRR